MHKIESICVVTFMATILGVAFFPNLAFAEQVTISYDLNGVAPVVYTSDGENDAVVKDVQTQFDGYTLTGWNDKADGSGKTYKVGDHVSKNVTLYAQWANGDYYNTNNSNTTNRELVQTGVSSELPATIFIVTVLSFTALLIMRRWL